jgi:1,4-dihydroxy-2-naphthoate octaprenyltransferase
VVLTHISVNLFNELSDYRTGIDRHTFRTPFSGGSGMMQAGKTSPGAVAFAAYSSMAVSAAIGLYFFALRGWLILVFMIFGAVAIRFYTPVLARWLLGELFSGLTLGSFVVMGTYYALSGRLGIDIILLSIPPGILTSMLLFLNEFPDAEADRKGGRYHLVIHLGKKKSSTLYAVSMVCV